MSTTAHSLHRELPHAGDELMTIKEVATLVRVPEATLRYGATSAQGRTASGLADPSATSETTSGIGLKNSPVIHGPANEQCATSVIKPMISSFGSLQQGIEQLFEK